ncbi:formylmethanofuran dehydrogenase, subunit D (tungsten) (fwdD) [Methanocaldococcus jannaschii DSM 2661]|uniref:Protein FwdD n=1 Tax=Methanocaldococcus jannaschii (strain ATCC 43067 / DSM 2661 / JAL-1 / JCM 10045 / NBRC 100440) TaxID=243232 RepID=FWDD_METJA|nr:tungsten-dependent formylmethanofuran dehydrogenase subunit FwdD [Methanocaldococcus jannaschii]Q58568.1 RecName: Full=Protein FwdD [Methanocaldococcus jannaschii DSM 2661]AAB99170.1 formylmethanofuran dehydrogenase, subunit D (tungsten) (fwdD) [Methanocaldococcus jannaschii DSM 2661]
MKFFLNTGRTIWQGEAMEAGKNLDLYVKAAGVVYINEEDMEKLGVKEGDKVKVKSEYGEVVVYVKKATERMPEGMIYIPMGPWANCVVKPDTHSTGMPTFKGYPGFYVEVEKTDEEFLDMRSLMRKKYIEAVE